MDEEFNVKLSDFGLARTFRSDDNKFAGMKKSEISKLLRDEIPLRRMRVRRLSNHVQTRFYRSPEVILLEREYNSRADLWSLGCCIAEMESCSEAYESKGSDISQRITFFGHSCYPLSPVKDGSKDADEKDQLSVILKSYGEITAKDASFITAEEAFQHVEDRVDFNIGKINFEKEYEASDFRLARILKNILEFNPYFRKPASELLRSSLFDGIRNPELEEPCD